MSNEALAKVLAHKNPLTRMYREGTWPMITQGDIERARHEREEQSWTPIVERLENVVPQYRNPVGDWFLFWSKPVVDRRAVGFELWYSYVVLPHR